MFDAFCVQIRQDICGTDSALQIGRIYQGKEKIGGADDVMATLSGFTNRTIQRNPTVGRA
jgi:hypothetical protein